MSDRDDFDYVIIGAGTAGATLANRLSADPSCRVLLLEAGGEANSFFMRLPIGYYRTMFDDRFSHAYRSAPDSEMNDRQIDCPRGRVLGGSSSINGLIFIRGQQQDFDDWAKLGATGWDHQSVLPYFRQSETYFGPPSQERGAHGPLGVSDLQNRNPACEAWLAAAQAYGLPANEDFNSGDSLGVGRYQLSVRGRWRDSSATAFLEPARKRPNLTVLTHAQVLKINIAGGIAESVTYHHRSATKTVAPSAEILLCAGAVQSPQLLQLSGVGPADHLKKLGIPVQMDAPDVGENLQDHLQMRTLVELTDKRMSLNHQTRSWPAKAKMGLQWLFQGSGPLMAGAGQVGGAACTKYASAGRPDIQLFVMPLSLDKPGLPLHDWPGFNTAVWQCHPESRGSIRISTSDPAADPQIRLNYLSAAQDRKVLVEGVKIAREIYQQLPLRNLWHTERLPGPGVKTDEEILGAIRRFGGTVFHLSGTCRMGSDDRAVVNPQLQVQGVAQLRVIDASVMPKIPSANINAPTYMIAEKAAAMIIQGQA